MLPIQTDVSKLDQIEALAKKTMSEFGAVHLLFNNAGVAAGGTIWESTAADWDWVMGVNLWGVIHGIRAFVPFMLEQGAPAHIINTASVAGLLPYHPGAAYGVTKNAVVALSEQLHYELAQQEANINVSVLCPGWVNTKIGESGRNRPVALLNKEEPVLTTEQEALIERILEALKNGASPDYVAEQIFAAIREEKFYIIVNADQVMPIVQARNESKSLGQNPPPLPLSI